MSNSDRVVLALGGAGTVGSGIVKALLDKGKLPRGHLTTSCLNVVAESFPLLQEGHFLSDYFTFHLLSTLQVIETLLFSTFVSWKAFFPLVRDDSDCTYTFITGGAGDKLLMPGTGFLTVGSASTLAFCQVLREEYPQVPCKLNQVKIDAGVATPERMTPGYLNHLDLGEAVATLVERRNTSHTVFTVNCPADLKTVLLERNL
ncbi:uncharacterized protein si:dkey-238o13.4 [Etheostoma cragini]|uniref:uncharacterized protein si:dkey-238o13.4 n=1 Tax=Etheostoma cragini TaxID=417921 RepID=UPI00155E3B56|nr:uncharacterized protein si:dkey-238o13.4 [Etheostoma cragini]